MTPSLRALPTLRALLFALAAASTACMPRDSVPDVAAVSVDELIEAQVPRAGSGDHGWAYTQRGTADFDGDGAAESVVLISDVTLDANGFPLWEDGHRWQVYVEEPDGAQTHAYARFLPNGKLTAEVTTGPGDRPTIILLEQTPHRLALYELAYQGPGEISVVSSLERIVESGTTMQGSPRP